MQLLEIKAKVKSGKETELNQVLNDLIPQFESSANIKTQFIFNEKEKELQMKLKNNNSSTQANNILVNDHFTLFLGSIKVLCDSYAIIFPEEISI